MDSEKKPTGRTAKSIAARVGGWGSYAFAGATGLMSGLFAWASVDAIVNPVGFSQVGAILFGFPVATALAATTGTLAVTGTIARHRAEDLKTLEKVNTGEIPLEQAQWQSRKYRKLAEKFGQAMTDSHAQDIPQPGSGMPFGNDGASLEGQAALHIPVERDGMPKITADARQAVQDVASMVTSPSTSGQQPATVDPKEAARGAVEATTASTDGRAPAGLPKGRATAAVGG